MEKIDRWDVIKKTLASLETDAIKYLEQQGDAETAADKVNDQDQDMLTLADISRLKQGLEVQHYDAFLLYADEDINFVNEMVEKLETEYQLKLCLKDRDLINGVFEHDAIMRLISERCNRLLIILSPNFLKCSANKFLLSFTQALSIEKRQRILIPCIYERCEVPLQLRYIYNLDYNCKGLYDFWGKLSNSIKAPNSSCITSSVKQETAKSFSDERISQPAVQEKEALNSQEKVEYKVAITKMDDTQTVNNNSKKNKTLLRWIKPLGNSKAKQTKQNSQLIKKPLDSVSLELDNLPSVDNMDSLSDLDIPEKKKHFFNKFKKKRKAEKIAMKI
ncbi:Myeloid differentiation primary response protein MyD88 [Ooceraea biroi]|nr:Myeloid differentiation primary response protein MyD88 [Ooceraea biroi]